MEAVTGGSAQEGCLRDAMSAGSFAIPAHAGARCRPVTFFSAVTRFVGNAHWMWVADDCRKVDS